MPSPQTTNPTTNRASPLTPSSSLAPDPLALQIKKRIEGRFLDCLKPKEKAFYWITNIHDGFFKGEGSDSIAGAYLLQAFLQYRIIVNNHPQISFQTVEEIEGMECSDDLKLEIGANLKEAVKQFRLFHKFYAFSIP